MKPLRFIEMRTWYLSSKSSQYVPTHREENQRGVDTETKASSTRYPDGKFQGVQGGQILILSLQPPMTISSDGVVGDRVRTILGQKGQHEIHGIEYKRVACSEPDTTGKHRDSLPPLFSSS